VATNLAINHLQRYRRRWRLFSEMEPVQEDGGEDGAGVEFPVPDSMPAELDTEQHRALIEDALRELPADQRAALVLYHFEDFSYQEIAARLGASLAKVRRHPACTLRPATLAGSRGIGRVSLEH